MNSNLLSVPLRQSRPIDLGEELRAVIKRDYFQTASSFEADLTLIQELRNNITKLTEQTIDQNSIKLLIDYYKYLTGIKKKFPDDCIEFAWYSTLTYGPSGPTKTRSLRIEQLNILYQLGSLYSQLGMKESRYTDDGLKKACSFFQMASGSFNLMATTIATENIVVPPDFQKDTLMCLKYLNLAQSQETIWQKALSNTAMKDSVIGRLSFQTSEYYSQALVHGNNSDFIKLEWINHISVKKFHFKAAAHFRMSIVNQDAFQYGEQVAHLRVAAESCDLAAKRKKYVNPFVLEDLTGLTNTIKDTLRVAEKDNDLVYLKIVPSAQDLKPIVGASMVSPSLPDEIKDPVEYQIFKELLPFIIIQVAQAFRERQDNFVRERVVAPIESLNNIITKFLSDRNLPASIDSIQQPENLPDSIVQHSQEITSLGGTRVIEDTLQEIKKLSLQGKKLLQECYSRMDLEKEEDEMLRQRQGSQNWNRPVSEDAGKHLYQKIHKMDEYFNQASAGDEHVAGNYMEIKPHLELYCGGYKSLINYVPNSTYVSLNQSMSNIISDLRGAVNEVNKSEEKRKQFLHELEIKARDNNILPKVIEQFKSKQDQMYDENGVIQERIFETVYEQHLKLFQQDLEYFEQLKQHQVTLEQEIETLNQRFISEYENTTNESQLKRQEVLQALETVYSKYLEVISNLKEGSQFYSDYIEKGNCVLKECEDFLYHRRLEGRDLELDIASKLRGEEGGRDDDDGGHSPKSTNYEDQGSRIVSPTKSRVWDPSQAIKFG